MSRSTDLALSVGWFGMTVEAEEKGKKREDQERKRRDGMGESVRGRGRSLLFPKNYTEIVYLPRYICMHVHTQRQETGETRTRIAQDSACHDSMLYK
jgi:hypothetical protein